MYVCPQACRYVGMWVCMHWCMYAFVHLCMYACMYVCMLAWMHACLNVLTAPAFGTERVTSSPVDDPLCGLGSDGGRCPCKK